MPKTSTQMFCGANTSESVCSIEYGKDRLQAVIQLRRQQEMNVPKDTREELTRYKTDFVSDKVKDLLLWWKVQYTFILFYYSNYCTRSMSLATLFLLTLRCSGFVNPLRAIVLHG